MLSIHRASAGSGKTFTLARDYIRLVLGRYIDGKDGELEFNYDPARHCTFVPCRHRSILAITFTRKATEEMKSRILKELNLLANPAAESDHRKYLTDFYGVSGAVLAEAAEAALQQLLFDYGNFNVSTIDSFFQRVLHTFARELDRQSDFDIEMSDYNAMRNAVNRMLDDFNSSPIDSNLPLENWIYDYISDEIKDSRKGTFFNRQSKTHTSLIKSLTYITKEAFKPWAKQMKEYLATNKLAEYKKSLREIANGASKKCNDLVRARINLAMCEGMNGKSVYTKAFNAVLSGTDYTDENWKKVATNDGVLGISRGEKSAYNKGKGSPEQDAIVADVLAQIVEIQQNAFLARSVLASLPFLGLLAYCWHYLDSFAQENNLLLISDTNELVHKIIEHDDAPFIYERMGCRLSHFLMDEFQDTSSMQWSNLRPLVANGLSQSFDSLVIGDVKQSIYRWRNSDSSILREQVEADLKSYLNPDVPQSRTNFRSSPGVIRFNNTIFSIMAAQLGVPGYDNVVQKISDKHRNEPSYIRFCQTDTGSKPDPGYITYNSEQVLHQMASHIIRQHTEGKYPWREIAVLTNTNKEARKVVQFLLDNYSDSISVMSDEALMLNASPAVQTIISVLRTIDKLGAEPTGPQAEKLDPWLLSKAQARSTLARYEFILGQALADASREAGRPLTPDEIARVCSDSLHAATDDKADPAAQAAIKAMADKPSSLLALIESVIGMLFPPQERTLHTAYIAALQDAVLDFSSQGAASLHSFIEWFDANSKLTVTGSEEADAIRVMTIHKSKGLEFGCVHIPFCKWTLTWDQEHCVWVETPHIIGIDDSKAPDVLYLSLTANLKNLDSPLGDVYRSEISNANADCMNKTYVAFTRAKRELHVWWSSSGIGTLINAAFTAGRPADFDPQLMEDLRPHFAPLPADPDAPCPMSTLSIGEPTTYIPDSSEAKKNEAKDEAITVDYQVNKHSAADAVLKVKDMLDELRSDIDDNEEKAESKTPDPGADGDSEDVRRQGIILHDMMSRIRHASDAPRAVKAEARACRLPKEHEEAYLAIIQAHIAQAKAEGMNWYDGFSRSYVEQPIYVMAEDFVRRPDRVVILPDGEAQVIDYKFTTNPRRILCDDHQDQVRLYGRLLRELGYARVRCFLAYPRLSTIKSVKFP